MYFVFEGVIGTGKSTQSKLFYEFLKEKYPNKQVIWTREPGGDEVADAIRKVVQGTKFQIEMEFVCEAYLYAASRAQTLRSIVKPVLDVGGIVVADRSYLTSYTNQAFGRQLGLELVSKINESAVGTIFPDRVFFMDLDIEEGIKRSFDHNGDKFESLGVDFYQRVYDGYKKISETPEYKNKWVNINAHGSVEEVFERIKLAFESFS